MDDIKPPSRPAVPDTQSSYSASSPNAEVSAAPTNEAPENTIGSQNPGPEMVGNFQPESSHRKSHKLLWIILTLLLVGTGAAACYLTLTTTKNTAVVSPVASPVKKDIPNLRYATVNSGWDKFYPAIDNSSNYEESNRQIFEGLVRYQNRTKIVPLLATGWKNPDTSTWVFTLKHGVLFHSGREMKAEDVKASFDAAKTSEIGQLFADSISSVTVDGPYQVTIRTAAPDATLLNKLTNYYVYDTKSGKTADPINGTGPYITKTGAKASASSLELVAFDKYHEGRPTVRSLSFISLSDNDFGKAYNDNKADVMSLSTDTPTAVKSRKYNQISLQPIGTQLLVPNTTKAGSPLKNLKVRQALQMSLDQSAIAKARGVSFEPATQVVPKAIPGYNSDIKPVTINAAAARQLLTDAGYPKGISLKLSYYSPLQVMAVEISKEASTAGITFQLDPQTDPSVLGTIASSGKTDTFLVRQTSDILDSSDVLTNLANAATYKNQAVLDLVAKAQASLDPTKHIDYLKQANAALMSDVGAIPLFVPSSNNIVIYNPTYNLQRDIENGNLGVYFWNVYGR